MYFFPQHSIQLSYLSLPSQSADTAQSFNSVASAIGFTP